MLEGGEYQGAIFPFTGGLEAAANRIMTGPDGAIYVGGLGTDEWSGWWWDNKRYGLQRLTPNGKSFFDILAVRSLGPTKMEIEFTGPAGASAASAANYKVQTWNYTPQFTYGAGKGTAATLNVKSITASDDKTKVTIEIDGMKAKYVVYFKLSNVTSAANEALWSTEAWYTQNAFGPGVPVNVPTPAMNRSGAPRFSMRPATGGRWSLSIPGTGAYTLEILSRPVAPIVRDCSWPACTAPRERFRPASSAPASSPPPSRFGARTRSSALAAPPWTRVKRGSTPVAVPLGLPLRVFEPGEIFPRFAEAGIDH